MIHPTAIIDEGAIIGARTKVWHFSHIMSKAEIGNDCVIGQNVFVGNNVVIGNGVKIQNNVSLYDGVIIEDYVFLSPSCVFTNVTLPRASVEQKDNFKQTIVREGATIGANATIICGNTIGAGAMVGAGAVVTKDVPPNTLVTGVPAKEIRKL